MKYVNRLFIFGNVDHSKFTLDVNSEFLHALAYATHRFPVGRFEAKLDKAELITGLPARFIEER